MEYGAVGSLLITYRYWLLFPVACFEGPFVAFLVGILSGLGYFNPYIAFVILVFGDIIPDSLLYMLGRYGKKRAWVERYGHRIGVTEARFKTASSLWHEHPRKTMFFSKLAYGISSPFLLIAGLSDMRPYMFYTSVIPITMIHYGVLEFLGYHFGNSLTNVQNIAHTLEIGVTILVIAFVLYYYLTRSFRSKLLKGEEPV